MATAERMYRFKSDRFIVSKDETEDLYRVRKWRREQPVVNMVLVSTPEKEALWTWSVAGNLVAPVPVDHILFDGHFHEALKAACAAINQQHEREDSRSHLLEEAESSFSRLVDYDPGRQ